MPLSYLKGLRTRYKNLLAKELDKSPDLLREQADNEHVDSGMRRQNGVTSTLVDLSRKLEETNEKP